MRWCLITTAVLTVVVNIRAADPPGKDPTSQVAALLSARPSEPIVMWFEASLSGKSSGFSTASLTPSGSEASRVYDYRSDSVMVLPNGARLEAQVSARLQSSLQPVSAELRRTVVLPDGKRESTVERAEVKEKEVLLTREAAAGGAAQRTVPRPEGAFVFAVEFLVPHIDLKRFPAFELREFDPQEGTTIAHSFQVETAAAGTRKLSSREPDGSVGYVFEVDERGDIASWGEPPLPLIFKRVTKEKGEELRRSVARP